MIRGFLRALILAALLGVSVFHNHPLHAEAWRISYLNAGVASLDETWIATDYERAVQAIITAKIPLPAFKDSRGKAVLKRIVSEENLAFIQNKDLPVTSRMENFMLMQSSMSALLGHYVTVANQGKVSLPDELIACYGFMLQTTASGIGLTDEYLATIPKDDKYESRIESLKQVQAGIVGMLVGAEMTLNEDYYSKRNRSDLLVVISETLLRFKPILPNEFKIEYRVKLVQQKKKFKDRQSLQLLNQMTELLAH
jgi:hypothetical protein